MVFESDGTLRHRYIALVIQGFEKQYLWLLEHKRRWSEMGGPISWLEGLHVRVLLRSTSVYTVIADWLLSLPNELKSSGRRAAALALSASRNAGSWPDSFVEADLVALARGDIPFWSTPTDSYDFYEAGGGIAHGLIERTGMMSVHARADNMSEKDLENQTFLIKTFLRIADTPTTRSRSPVRSIE
jgi:lantibiotic modifying enzyme